MYRPHLRAGLAAYALSSALCLLPGGAGAQDAITFTGYVRAAIGVSTDGGRQMCFGLASADTKYRLGNECDADIEPTFTFRWVHEPNGSVWGFTFMPAIYRTWNDPDQASGELPAQFNQVYLFGEKVPELARGRIWAGRRFYDRLQTNINDQFLENEDGDGAGIEDMDLGFGKLSIAWLMNPYLEPINNENGVQWRTTARLTDIRTLPAGALSLWLGYYGYSADDDAPNASPEPDPQPRWRVGVYHTLGDILGGSNLSGAKIEYSDTLRQWRVVSQQTAFVAAWRTNFDGIIEYRSRESRDNENLPWAKNDWFTIGARSDTQISGPFRFLIELGHDRVMPRGGETQTLTKLTVAGAMSAGTTAAARPTFRLYYTYARWNEAAKGPGGVYDHPQAGALRTVAANDTSGSAVGIQGEAWW